LLFIFQYGSIYKFVNINMYMLYVFYLKKKYKKYEYDKIKGNILFNMECGYCIYYDINYILLF